MITSVRRAAARAALAAAVVWIIAAVMSSSPAVSRIAFQDARRATPTSRDAARRIDSILQRAAALIEQGELTRAKAILSKGLESYSRDPGLHNFLGVVEARQHDFDDAEASFQSAIQESPQYSGAYLNLGHLYLEYASQNPSLRRKALETYFKMLRFDPENPEGNYESAIILSEDGDFGRSLSCLRKMPVSAQNRTTVLGVQLADDAGLGKHPEARVALRELLSAPGFTEADALTILPALEKSSQPELVIQLLEGLESRGEASPSTLSRLAELEERQGQLERARQIFEKVAAAEPQSTTPLIKLARIANRQRDDRGALGYLAHARALQPGNASTHFFFGMVCVEMDLHREAYVSLKKAVELDPENPYYNYALGAVCTEDEDGREAIPYFKKYCALKARDPRGELALGSAYYYSHELDAARIELLKVADDKSTAAGANYFLGRIANDLGKWPEAARYLQTAIRDYPTYADAYAALGSVYLNQKDYSEAAKALLHALQIEPDNYLANLKLLILYRREKDARAAAQARRFAGVKREGEQRTKLFLRTIRVAP